MILVLICIASLNADFNLQYGLSSVSVMASIGNIYFNFGLWAIAIVPAWIIKQIGHVFGDKKIDRDTRVG